MGMYDTVRANCPKCNNVVDFQSKSGDCRLELFEPHDVPLAVALDVHEQVEECSGCGYAVTLRMAVPIKSIVMVVT